MSPNPIVKVQLQGRAPAGVAGLEREGDASSFSACLAGLMSLPRYPFQQGPKTGRPENPAAPAERETGVTPGPAGQAAVALADGSGDLWPAAAEGTQRVGRGAEATVLVSPAGGAGTKGPGGSLRAAVPAEGAAASIPELSPSRGGAQSPDERILPTANFSRSSASFGAVPSGLPAAGEEVAQAIPRAAAGPGEHGQRRPGAGPHGVRVADKGAAGTAGAGATEGPREGAAPGGRDAAPVRGEVIGTPAAAGEKSEGRPLTAGDSEPGPAPVARRGALGMGEPSPGTGSAAGSAAAGSEKSPLPPLPAGVQPSELAARIISLTRGSRADRQELELQLKPPWLGKMRLYTVLVDNRLSVHMVVETPEAGRLLQASLPELRQSLQGQGLSLDQVQVQVNGGYAGDREGPAGREEWSGSGGPAWRWPDEGGEHEELLRPSRESPYMVDYLA